MTGQFAPTITTLRRQEAAPPVRIVHLGLGAFSRSHLAWYTHAAADASAWGISAYTGASRELADRLTAQNGLYTLVERGEDGDTAEVITSLVRAQAGGDVSLLTAEVAAPTTAVVTLTITEVGYRLTAEDAPDSDDALVAADLDRLRAVMAGQRLLGEDLPDTALGKLLWGLEVRRRTGGGPLAVISCDNLPDNGGRLSRGLAGWTAQAAPLLGSWISDNVAFVSSSVDRITPRVSDAELRALRGTYGDKVPVVAEPFHDWVVAGEFPAGRPAWETAGARFVDDLEPWEARKLWLLNGAHTILAALGRIRGHENVADAIGDSTCRAAVEQFWDEAERHLPKRLDVPAYRTALLARFSNPRIEHQLAQIAIDDTTKVRLRIVPVAERERTAGRAAPGAAHAIAAWILTGDCADGRNAHTAASTVDKVDAVSPELARDHTFTDTVDQIRRRLLL